MAKAKGSPKTGGRKKGSKNLATRDMQELLDKVFEKVNPAEKLIQLLNKPMDAGVEARVLLRLLEYRYGQPMQPVEASGPGGGPIPISIMSHISRPKRDSTKD